MKPTLSDRAALSIVTRFLRRTRFGKLELVLPDGQIQSFGPCAFPTASLQVASWGFFSRLLRDGDVAMGDGWVADEWASPDLTAVIRFFIDNRDDLDDRSIAWSRWLGRISGWLRHRLRANSESGSRLNIQAHYDLGNELYRAFLGPTMVYSCAYFASPEDDLERAQVRKMDLLLDQARLEPDSHMLDLGCGWGTLAIRAAQRFGCRVTGISLSPRQLEWGRRAVAESGLNHLIELNLCDYRRLQGKFDRIISCEMLEAVGHAYYDQYFAALERLLKPDGLAVLQVITVPDFSYQDYRRNPDWIQKEIFPGALCPALCELLRAVGSRSQLVLESLSNIGPHYAKTLRIWRERFSRSWPELPRHLYDEQFRRRWLYYLCYCEAAFASRNLADLQMVLTRPKNPLLLQQDPPWLRQDHHSDNGVAASHLSLANELAQVLKM